MVVPTGSETGRPSATASTFSDTRSDATVSLTPHFGNSAVRVRSTGASPTAVAAGAPTSAGASPPFFVPTRTPPRTRPRIFAHTLSPAPATRGPGADGAAAGLALFSAN